jgi:hypothetical protein
MAEVLKKPRKKAIPATLKRLVWNKYIGEEIGKAKCTCCNTTDIIQMSFHCGHLIASSNGGKMEIDNLRPICQNCNSSMGSANMESFKAALQIAKQPLVDIKKIKEFESEYQKCILDINRLKTDSQKAKPTEERKYQRSKEMDDIIMGKYMFDKSKIPIPEYKQIDIDISNLEKQIMPMLTPIMQSKSDVEFTELYAKFDIERQNLNKLSDKLKIRWPSDPYLNTRNRQDMSVYPQF